MKTAKEWLNQNGYTSNNLLISIINEARKETIEECAKVAKVKVEGGNGYSYVNKESILSLIKELK